MVSLINIVLLASTTIASAASLQPRLSSSIDTTMLWAYGATPDSGIGGVRLTYGDGP